MEKRRKAAENAPKKKKEVKVDPKEKHYQALQKERGGMIISQGDLLNQIKHPKDGGPQDSGN